MRVIKSRILGCCHGVDKTIRDASLCVNTGKLRGLPCYSIGNLIHNTDVVRRFEEQGLRVIKKPEDGEPGAALIRAHGIPDSLRRNFEAAGFELIDSTCINIRKSRELIRKAAQEGRKVVVLGVRGHAETVCLMDTETAPDCPVKTFLVSDEYDLEELYAAVDSSRAVTVITQTTFPDSLFCRLTEELKRHFSDIEFGNGLCKACAVRRHAAEDLASECDAVVVVGGRNSRNTMDLAAWVEKTGVPVFCVENTGDFTPELKRKLSAFKTVGVCSGTSTPLDITNAVCNCLASL